jgi:hypothetical protein
MVLPILEGVPNPTTTWTYNASSGFPPPPPAPTPDPFILPIIIIVAFALYGIAFIEDRHIHRFIKPAFEPKLGHVYRLKFADASMDGDYKLVRVEKSPVYDKKGKVSGYSACYVMERRP